MNLLLIFGLFILAKLIDADSNADLLNSKVDRTIDLTSHLTRIITVITLENTASSGSLKGYTYTVEPAFVKNIAFIGAQLVGEKGDSDKKRLNVVELPQDVNKGALFRIDFKNELAAGKNLKLEVELVLFKVLKPYPAEITQQDKQLVLFKANHLYYSLYPTKQQTTVVNLASDKTESYSQLKPTSKSDSTITYGPYENIKPFETSEMSIHYENNSPFITVTNLIRVIEISHWGNIAIEETIDMYHSGAVLKGPFSRFDYMRRQGGASSVKSFRTLLPSSASDVYYRDEIGNISTSNLRLPGRSKSNEPVELELRPRFPLFGGWKTHYTVGYNVPVYQFLFNKGNDYLLKMRLVDHIYDDQFIENVIVKIILPEHSTNIDLKTPYKVDHQPSEIHHTYLDTVGRTVIVIRKKNVVENHIQDFEVRYKFNKILILQEPLLVVAFFFAIFLFVILVVRIDFSLTHRINEHAKKE